ncbi:MAG: hypothetical protein LBK06_01850 [Planctomycetaceae bacterium]|nr:hypothetical protein [Planctomycetaceae bacterium]
MSNCNFCFKEFRFEVQIFADQFLRYAEAVLKSEKLNSPIGLYFDNRVFDLR